MKLRYSKHRWHCWFCSRYFSPGYYHAGACGHKHCAECWKRTAER